MRKHATGIVYVRVSPHAVACVAFLPAALRRADHVAPRQPREILDYSSSCLFYFTVEQIFDRQQSENQNVGRMQKMQWRHSKLRDTFNTVHWSLPEESQDFMTNVFGGTHRFIMSYEYFLRVLINIYFCVKIWM